MSSLPLFAPVSPAASPDEVTQAHLSFDQERDIQAAFEKFHTDNPDVYIKIVRFARQALSAGREKYSIATIFERLRWHYTVEVAAEEPFKLNNNYRSRYARLIMHNEPDLVGFFELRELKNGVPN